MTNANRLTAVVLLWLLALGDAPLAQRSEYPRPSKGSWDAVSELAGREVVVVETRDGARFIGTISLIDKEALSISRDSGDSVRVPRPLVRRVTLTSGRTSNQLTMRVLFAGLAGVAVAGLVGYVSVGSKTGAAVGWAIGGAIGWQLGGRFHGPSPSQVVFEAAAGE